MFFYLYAKGLLTFALDNLFSDLTRALHGLTFSLQVQGF